MQLAFEIKYINFNNYMVVMCYLNDSIIDVTYWKLTNIFFKMKHATV